MTFSAPKESLSEPPRQQLGGLSVGNWVSIRTAEDIPDFFAAFKGMLAQRTPSQLRGTSVDIPSSPAEGG